MKEQFELKTEHFTLLREANVQWDHGCYYGAPEVDEKRPYGNKDVPGDIHKILTDDQWDVDDHGAMPEELKRKYLTLHRETGYALQVILDNLGEFTPCGVYERKKYGGKWKLVSFSQTPQIK